jgi:hypothetical protein
MAYEYEDFDIRILKGEKTPMVEASYGPLGRAQAPLGKEITSQSTQDLIQKISARPEAPGFDKLFVQLGTWLYESLFQGEVRDHWLQAVGRAESAGNGLRLRLVVDPPEIAALPWEFLFHPERQFFLATNFRTPLVRYLDQRAFPPMEPLQVEPPLRMLVVIPQKTGLDVKAERSLIEKGISRLPRGVLEVKYLDRDVTLDHLADAIQEQPFHILHYVGHGDFDTSTQEGYLLLNKADGSDDWISQMQFGALIMNQRSLRLVVLNACKSAEVSTVRAFAGMAPKLVASGVPAVAAMQYEILDRDALAFARTFYRTLSSGEWAGQVDVALANARNRLLALHPNSRGFGTPVLYLRAKGGRLFSIPHGSGEKPASAASGEIELPSKYRFYTTDMLKKELQSLRKRLEINQRNLQAYRQRRDTMGDLYVPPFVLSEIDRLEEEVASIQSEIEVVQAVAERKGFPGR